MGRWPQAVLLDGTPKCGSFRRVAFWAGALFFVLVLSGVPGLPLAVASAPDGWEVVSSTETRLHLRIQVPQPELVDVDVDGRS